MHWFLYLIVFLPVFATAQNLKAVSIAQTPLNVDRFIGVDEYQDLYYINENVFHKKSSKKNLQFSDLQLGSITTADIVNPLRITLFYEQFNTAVILDNALNEIIRIDFNKIEDFKNITHARTASDQRLWIFNRDLRQLELYDYRNNNVRITSPPLAAAAEQMVSDFNTCWIYTGKTLQAFNNYGSLLYSMEAEGLDQLYQFRQSILAVRDGKVTVLDKNKKKFKTVDLDEKVLDQLYWAQEILYIYNGKTLNTYSLNFSKT